MRALSIAVNVSATNAEIATEPPTTMPNSLNSRPVSPCRKMMGMNTAISATVVEMMAKNTSREPACPAATGSMPSSIFEYTFSSMTMASSTTSPMASTTPRSVSTLIEKPHRYMMKNTPTSEMGTARTGISVVRQSRKKKKMIAITSRKAIRMVSRTSTIDLRM
jgi:hypothetical protein